MPEEIYNEQNTRQVNQYKMDYIQRELIAKAALLKLQYFVTVTLMEGTTDDKRCQGMPTWQWMDNSKHWMGSDYIYNGNIAAAAAFTPGHMLPSNKLLAMSPVALNIFLVSATKLLTVCCWIQRDKSRPWHKRIVIMSPRFSQPLFRTRNLYPATYMYPDTSCLSGTHVAGQHVVLV